MNDKIKLADGSDWDNITDFTGASHMYATSDYEFLCLRRKKPEENKHEGLPTPIKTHYADQLVPTYEAFETLQRRVEELENRRAFKHDEVLLKPLEGLSWRKK
jgi:hypothetical protein